MRRGPSIALLAVTALVPGCPRTIRTGALIDQYSRAECVPVRFAPGVSRAWDYTLKTREGIAVHVLAELGVSLEKAAVATTEARFPRPEGFTLPPPFRQADTWPPSPPATN